MADRGILFSAQMVRALLDGRKTQTRRILKPQPFPVGGPFYRPFPTTDPRQWHSVSAAGMIANIQTVPYAVGDQLWVREAYTFINLITTTSGHHFITITYDADGDPDPKRYSIQVPKEVIDKLDARKIDIKKKPRQLGRFMFRALSRITLLVTDVRIQRLQECTATDALSEGIEQFSSDPLLWRNYAYPSNLRGTSSPITSYRTLWNHINGDGAWDKNPWVVALTFRVGHANINNINWAYQNSRRRTGPRYECA